MSTVTNTNAINDIIQMARAVCFWIPPERLSVSIEPFDTGWRNTPSPHGWCASVILYKDEYHTKRLAVLASAKRTVEPMRPEWKYDPDTVLEDLRSKMIEALRPLVLLPWELHPSLYECQACTDRIGRSALCSRCTDARDIAGDGWRGPRGTERLSPRGR